MELDDDNLKGSLAMESFESIFLGQLSNQYDAI